ncbi:hypothetical protein MANES_06G006950v8, partial [Manihot esculenta]
SGIPFSAFWLRSSVVSVLISLISDTWTNGSHDIKFIFLWGEPITVACYWGSHASPMRCTAVRIEAPLFVLPIFAYQRSKICHQRAFIFLLDFLEAVSFGPSGRRERRL